MVCFGFLQVHETGDDSGEEGQIEGKLGEQVLSNRRRWIIRRGGKRGTAGCGLITSCLFVETEAV